MDKTEKHDRYVLLGCLEVPLLVVTDGLDTLEGRVRFLFFCCGSLNNIFGGLACLGSLNGLAVLRALIFFWEGW